MRDIEHENHTTDKCGQKQVALVMDQEGVLKALFLAVVILDHVDRLEVLDPLA